MDTPSRCPEVTWAFLSMICLEVCFSRFSNCCVFVRDAVSNGPKQSSKALASLPKLKRLKKAAMCFTQRIYALDKLSSVGIGQVQRYRTNNISLKSVSEQKYT